MGFSLSGVGEDKRDHLVGTWFVGLRKRKDCVLGVWCPRISC